MSQQINVDVKGGVDKQLIDGLDAAVTGATKLADALKKLPKKLPSLGDTGGGTEKLRTNTDILAKSMLANTAAINTSSNAIKGYISEVATATKANDMAAVSSINAKISQEKTNVAMANAAIAAAKEKQAMAGLSGQLSGIEKASLNAAKSQNRLANTMAGSAVRGASALQAEIKGVGHEIKGLSAVAGVMQGSLGSISGRLHALSFLFDGVSKSTIAAGVSMAGFIGSLAILVPSAIKLEKTMSKLEAVTHSNGAAFELVKEESTRTGASLYVLGDSFANIAIAAEDSGVSAKDAEAVFKGLNTASQALGMSTDDTAGVMKAMTQIMSKGKVQMEELRGQLGDRLTGALGKAAKAMGLTSGELEKMVEQGNVIASDFIPKFAKVLQEDYADAAVAAGKTVAGSMKKVSAQFELLSGSVLSGGVLFSSLAEVLQGVASTMEVMNKHPRTTQVLFTALSVATLVLAGRMLFASKAALLLKERLIAMAAAATAANIASGGLMFLATAGAALVAATVAYSIDEAYAISDSTSIGIDSLSVKIVKLKEATATIKQEAPKGFFKQWGEGLINGMDGISIMLDSWKKAPETLAGTQVRISALYKSIADSEKQLEEGTGVSHRLVYGIELDKRSIEVLEASVKRTKDSLNKVGEGKDGKPTKPAEGKGKGKGKEIKLHMLKYQKLAAMGKAFDYGEESRIAGRLNATMLGIDAEEAAFLKSEEFKAMSASQTSLVLLGYEEKKATAHERAAQAMRKIDDEAFARKATDLANMAEKEAQYAQQRLDLYSMAATAQNEISSASTKGQISNVRNFSNAAISMGAGLVDMSQRNAELTTSIEASSGQERADFEKELAQNKMDMTSSSLDMISGLMASSNREMFEIGKAAAYANTLVSMYSGATRAYSDLPIWAAIPASIAIVAAGMVNLNKISSTSLGSKSASAAASAKPSIGMGTAPTSAQDNRTPPATIVNVYNTGNVMTDTFAQDTLIPSIQSAVATGDLILVPQDSANGQLLAGTA